MKLEQVHNHKSTQKEIDIVQHLASTDTLKRNKALNNLSKYFSTNNDLFNEMQFLKIWNGLYTSLWMQDKPILQEELSVKIADLTNLLKTSDQSLLFIKCFFIVIEKKWPLIDQYRLDKFYALVRKMLSAGFKTLAKSYKSGDNDTLPKFTGVLMSTILNPKQVKSNGIIMHFADIFLEEFYKISQGHVDPSHLNKLIMPFIAFMANSEDEVSITRINQRVFDKLLTTYAPFGTKDQFYVPNNAFDEDEEPELFPTNFAVLAKLFFKVAADKSTLNQNRRVLYQLNKKFKDAENLLNEIAEGSENIILNEDGEPVNGINDPRYKELLESNENDDEDDEDDDENDDEDLENIQDEDDDEDFDMEDLDDDSEEEEEEEEIITPPPKNIKKPSPQPIKKQTPIKQNNNNNNKKIPKTKETSFKQQITKKNKK